MHAGMYWQEEDRNFDQQAMISVVPDNPAEKDRLKQILAGSGRPDIKGVHQFIALVDEDRDARTISITLMAAETES